MPTLADYPHLVAQLDRTWNGPLDPARIAFASNKKYWWRCPEGPDHVWLATVSHRTTRGDRCPYCANKAVSVTNSLAKRAPALAKQWHPTFNGDLRPTDVVVGSHQRVWWKCPKAADHEWQTSVDNRTVSKNGCPFCGGKRASLANNLAVLAPHLVPEWHRTKNGELRPADVTPGSPRRVWWQCPEGKDHVWIAGIAARAHRSSGCPFCSGHAVCASNCLAKRAPAVARQWHPARNGDLTPRDVVTGSHKRVWWQCPEGPDHAWQATVYARTGAGNQCPFCSGQRATAKRNLAVIAPRLAREWHPTRNGAITPRDVLSRSGRPFWWRCAHGHEWQAIPKNRVKGGTGCPYCQGRKATPETSLAAVDPTLAKQWHPTRNGKLTPRDVMPMSTAEVWWRCPEGADHVWEAQIAARHDRGCPFCSSKRISSTNSLAAVYPDLAAEWHPTRNGKLTPREVTWGSGQRVWWRCAAGPDHEWATAIRNRHSGNGCPFCMNRKVSVTNCLATVEPKLAAEWHPTKNGKLTPRHVTRGAGKMVWWRCQFGHEWKASPNHRTHKGDSYVGCPGCRKPRPSAVATTGKRGRRVSLSRYEGAHHGPVRRVP